MVPKNHLEDAAKVDIVASVHRNTFKINPLKKETGFIAQQELHGPNEQRIDG
jgi:hypothetical protein